MVILRQSIRWLLWSRRRFLLVVTTAVVLAVVLARAPALIAASTSSAASPATTTAVAAPPSNRAPPPPPPDPSSAPPPTPPSNEPSSERTNDTDDDNDDEADNEAGEADRRDEPRELALQFARLWASPDTAPREWLRRLEPLSTPEYAATVLAQVDPANVPASEVTGPPRRVQSPTGTAVYVVRFDRGFEAQIELIALSRERASENGDSSRSGRSESTPAEDTTWRVSALQPLGAA